MSPKCFRTTRVNGLVTFSSKINPSGGSTQLVNFLLKLSFFTREDKLYLPKQSNMIKPSFDRNDYLTCEI